MENIFGFDYRGIREGVDLFSPLIKRNMSNVSKELILELQQIIKGDYDREVSFAQVSEIGNGLVGYFDLLAKLQFQQDNPDEES